MSKKNGKPCGRCGTSDWYASGHCKVCKTMHNSSPHARNAYKVYGHSPKGMASNERYRKSAKGKAVRREHDARHDVKLRKKMYKQSARGKSMVKASTSRRRTRKTNAGGSFTGREWKELCQHYGNVCLKCGSGGKLTADHIVAVANGGTSNIDNIQPLCASCNSSKGAKNTDYRGGNFVTRWFQSKLF